MFKKLFFVLITTTLMITLTACRREFVEVDEQQPDVYYPEDYEYYEETGPTSEEIRADFETFFSENHDRLIREIATGGEDVRLELGEGDEFLLTIILDDIELDDDNRNLYALTFGLFFPEMADFFEEIATGIVNDANVGYFRLTAIIADMHGEEIARSRFDVVAEIEIEVE
jgi:hypothetical protein